MQSHQGMFEQDKGAGSEGWDPKGRRPVAGSLSAPVSGGTRDHAGCRPWWERTREQLAPLLQTGVPSSDGI